MKKKNNKNTKKPLVASGGTCNKMYDLYSDTESITDMQDHLNGLDEGSIDRWLEIAVEFNHTNTVLFLLKDGRAIPTQKMLYYASGYGNKIIVDALMTDQRIDPTYNNCEAYTHAVYKGRFEIVQIYINRGFTPEIKIKENKI